MELLLSLLPLFAVLLYLVIIAVAVAQYVLNALSLQALAERRDINNAWLAWVPIGDAWILGSIADDYDQRQLGLTRKWRVVMVLLPLLGLVLGLAAFFTSIGPFWQVILLGEDAEFLLEAGGEALVFAFLKTCGSLLLLCFLAAITSTAQSLCTAVCLFKLYESTRPEKALLFFLLSLLVPFGQPICLMLCCRAGYGNSDNTTPPAVPTAPTAQS